MRLILHKEAHAELDAAREYYARIIPQLALRFLDEFEHALRCIADAPEAWPAYGARTRRYLLKSFPYHVVYLLGLRALLIVAVAHAKRDPAYWRDRIGRG